MSAMLGLCVGLSGVVQISIICLIYWLIRVITFKKSSMDIWIVIIKTTDSFRVAVESSTIWRCRLSLERRTQRRFANFGRVGWRDFVGYIERFTDRCRGESRGSRYRRHGDEGENWVALTFTHTYFYGLLVHFSTLSEILYAEFSDVMKYEVWNVRLKIQNSVGVACDADMQYVV